MNTLITICARAGSKRLPGKNVKIFNGKPLMEWTLEQATDYFRYISCFDLDIVCCLDFEFLGNEVDWSYVDTMNRPVELSDDQSPKLEIVRWAVKEMEQKYGRIYDTVIDLDVTAPLRLFDDIEKAYQQFFEHRPPTLFSVVPARRKPWFNQVIKDFGMVELASIRNYNLLCYDMNAGIYIYDREWLNKGINHPVCQNSQLYIMQDWQAFDIDTQTDFKIAEFLHRKYVL